MKLLAIIFSMALLAGPLAAQTQGQQPAAEKQRITYRLSNQNTKYTQQHVLDVGDVPGHQVRILEVHRTFPGSAVASNTQPATTKTASASNASDAPVFNGVRAKEQWVQGVSDYVNGTGHVFGYATTVMENGDKVYSRYEAINQTGNNGRGNTLYVTTITGGTGQFKNLRGTIRGTGVLTFSEGRVTSNDIQYEGEYGNER